MKSGMSNIDELSAFVRPAAATRLLVLGGGGGIGFAIVEACAALGVEVVVMDMPQSIARRQWPQGVVCIDIDVRSEDSVLAAFAALPEGFAQLDALVNAFGYTGELASVEQTTSEVWDNMHDGNLRGMFLVCRAAMPRLRRAASASVVMFGTGIAQIGAAGYAAYATAKAGVGSLTRVLAAEGAPHIRVNAIAPGGIDTAFLRGGFAEGASEAGAPKRISIDDYAKRVPMARIGDVDDVLGPTLFLLSPASRYVTGQVLHVNGGALMRD